MEKEKNIKNNFDQQKLSFLENSKEQIGHTLTIDGLKFPLVPGVVIVDELLGKYGINPLGKTIKSKFKQPTLAKEIVFYDKQGDNFFQLKANDIVKATINIDTIENQFFNKLNEKEFINFFLFQDNKKHQEKTLNYNGQIFQSGDFNFVKQVKFYYQGNKISKGDAFEGKYEFNNLALAYLLEIVAQHGSLAVSSILDPNNDDKGKILTLDSFTINFLNKPEKGEIHLAGKIENVDKRNIFISFIITQKNKLIATGSITGNIVMKKLLKRYLKN